MRLICPECGEPIAAEDINIRALLAKCSACAEVFSFADRVRSETVSVDSEAPAPPRPIDLALPKGMTLEQRGERLTISRRWFSCVALPMLGFAACWDTFLVVWYAIAFSQEGPAFTISTLFPIIHVGIGIFITYYALAQVINRTVITVDDEVLKIVHTPLPWRGGKTIYVSAIKQIYVHRVDKYNRKSNRMTETFSVFALLPDEATVPIVEGLPSKAQALYLEQELERRLKITPAPVAGEYKPAAHELRALRSRPTGVSVSLPAEDEQLGVSLPDEEE